MTISSKSLEGALLLIYTDPGDYPNIWGLLMKAYNHFLRILSLHLLLFSDTWIQVLS
jgi:hypothetical protein